MTLTIKGATTIKSLTTVGFYPGSLFAAGEQGVWYDPSDMTTMFQDVAGTTPVTAVEQSVGLLLDKRSPAYSVYFDGTGDYLSAANSPTQLGSDDFTVEAWINTNYSSGSATATIGCQYDTGSSNSEWILGVRSGVIWSWIGATSRNGTIVVNNNVWHHVAWVRYGTGSNNNKIYVDGVLDFQFTDTNNLNGNSALWQMGRWGDGSTGYYPGYISNFRIVKGTALYTSNFTPTRTPLTPVSNTSLLTCGTSWSGNPTITVNGDAKANSLNPFGAATGNHAIQSSAGNRPVLSARVNLLTKTEDLTNATVWSYLSGASVVSAKVFSFTANDSRIYAATTSVTNNGVGYTLSASFSPADAGKKIRLAYFVSGSWTPGSDITIPANGYVSVTFTGQVTYIGLYAPSVDFTQTYTLLTGVDLRPTNQGVNLPTYQRVNTSSDYDTTNFPMYLKFDGTNMSLASTADISTNRFYIATGVLFEDITNNRFAISKGGSGNYYPAYGINAFSGNVTVSMYNGVPNTINASGSINRAYVVDGNYETSAYTATLNANQIGSIATSAAPTYNTDPFVLGIMAASGLGATYRLKGNLYGAMMVGRSLSNAEKLSMENWLNQKTKAY